MNSFFERTFDGKAEKQQEIIKMFDEIAPSYDKANRFMSASVDISWRKKTCKYVFSLLKNLTSQANNKNNAAASKSSGEAKTIDFENLVLADVACGTGDMILHWTKFAKNYGAKFKQIYGVDPSEKMLQVAKEKFAASFSNPTSADSPASPEAKDQINLQIIQAQATQIPLEAELCDFVSIAFGLRNVVEPQNALQEFARILKSGGLLVILEFLRPTKPSLPARLMNFYTRRILPFVGSAVAGKGRIYKYLPESIDNFKSREELVDLLKGAGFEIAHLTDFSAQVCSLIVAKKI